MSVPLALGWWKQPNGQRRLLEWHPTTGHLVLHRLDHKPPDLIAVVHDEDDLRRRLDDWPSHCDLRDGLGWVATQLQGCR